MIMLARILSCAGGDLGRQQIHNGAVLVSGPNGAVLPQKACTGALLAAKTKRAVKKSRHEPFETNRHLAQPPAKLVHHAIDHATANQGLADGDVTGPLWA